jgi:hypothetical protein
MKTVPIDVYYYPYDDVVCLRYRVDLITFYQFWSMANRDVFIRGLRQYKDDFEKQNLSSNVRQSRMSYGTVLGYAIWETSRISTQGRSYPDIDIGYYVKQKSSFFSITQREAENENPMSKESYAKSMHRVIYFTQAQADRLAALFEQDFLQGLTPDAEERGGFLRGLFN